MVVARPMAGGQPMVVATAQTRLDALAVARSREFAAIYGSCVTAVSALLRSGQSIAPQLLAIATSAGWGDRTSHWASIGWSPEGAAPADAARVSIGRDTWEPLVDFTGQPAYDARSEDIPRQSICDRWSAWTVDIANPTLVVRSHPDTPGESLQVARFERAEDAAFIPFARYAIAHLGAALAAVQHLARHCEESILSRDDVAAVLESTEPWPLIAQAQPGGPETPGAP